VRHIERGRGAARSLRDGRKSRQVAVTICHAYAHSIALEKKLLKKGKKDDSVLGIAQQFHFHIKVVALLAMSF
jgi:hypothetical protein